MPIEYLQHTDPSGLYICVDFILTAPWRVFYIIISFGGYIYPEANAAGARLYSSGLYHVMHRVLTSTCHTLLVFAQQLFW